MKKLAILMTLMLPALLNITPSAIAGGSPPSCSFKIHNCLDAKTQFWVFNGNDSAHKIAASNYKLEVNTSITLSCNASNCDTRFSYNDQTYWKNDHCGNIAVSRTVSGGATWLSVYSGYCPRYLPD
jgi:hypothetical protein